MKERKKAELEEKRKEIRSGRKQVKGRSEGKDE
jgi:hypothetical protein